MKWFKLGLIAVLLQVVFYALVAFVAWDMTWFLDTPYLDIKDRVGILLLWIGFYLLSISLFRAFKRGRI